MTDHERTLEILAVIGHTIGGTVNILGIAYHVSLDRKVSLWAWAHLLFLTANAISVKRHIDRLLAT